LRQMPLSGSSRPVRASVFDITIRRAAEERVRERELQFQQAQELARVARWEWDPATNHVQASPALYTALGVRSGDASLDDILPAIAPGDREDFQDALWRSLESDSPFDVELRVHPAGETEYVFHVRGKREQDLFGYRFHVVGAMQDITQRRR